MTTWSDDSGQHADIGRWDTPYTGPNPAVEPEGVDYYFVDIAVGDGGVLRFDYALETWDAGIWDWMDIYLETPVLAHFAQHDLLPSQKPALTSKHTQGLAIDANVVPPPGVDRDQLALGCSLYRPVKVKDPVHYVLVQD